MTSQISAVFSYGGASDYPGSSFGEELEFSISHSDSAAAIEEFVDWVIEHKAGVAAAIALSDLTEEVDPDGDFFALMDQLLSFELTAGSDLLSRIKVALRRSKSFSVTESVLEGNAATELETRFRSLIHNCVVKENPGPCLNENLVTSLK